MATQITATEIRRRIAFDARPLALGGSLVVVLASVALGAAILTGNLSLTAPGAPAAAVYSGTGATQASTHGALADDGTARTASGSYAGTGATQAPAHGALP